MKKIDIDIIPLMISAILVVISLLVIYTSNNILSLKHYIGISSLAISIFFYFKSRLTYYLIFGLTLLVGVLGPLDFYYQTFKIGFGNFGVNPIFISLLILHVALAFQMAEKIDAQK